MMIHYSEIVPDICFCSLPDYNSNSGFWLNNTQKTHYSTTSPIRFITRTRDGIPAQMPALAVGVMHVEHTASHLPTQAHAHIIFAACAVRFQYRKFAQSAHAVNLSGLFRATRRPNHRCWVANVKISKGYAARALLFNDAMAARILNTKAARKMPTAFEMCGIRLRACDSHNACHDLPY